MTALARLTTTTTAPGTVSLTVAGEIDLSNVAHVRQQVERAISGATRVVVDLSGLDYLDSQGIRLLADLARMCGDLSIVAPPDSIAGELLALTRLDTIVPVHHDHDDVPHG